MSNETSPAKRVDLTGTVCPMTFFKAKLFLQSVAQGELAEIVIKEGEQLREVPKNLKEEGHRIEAVNRVGEFYHLTVRKGE